MQYFKKIFYTSGFWFPILLFIIVCMKDVNSFSLYGSVILAFFVIFISDLSPSKQVNRTIQIFGMLFYNIILFIQISHFYLFNDHIKSSTLFIVFDSNSNETIGFLSMYLDASIICFLSLLMLFFVISILLSFKRVCFRIKSIYKVIFISVFCVSLLFYEVREQTFPHIIYRAFNEYKKDKQKLNQVVLDRLGGDFSEVSHVSNKKEIYVLIIGESTTRSHMQLYSYYRNTTPKLNSIKNDLVVFNDVISPHTHTLTSLGKVLTLASAKAPNKKYNGTLIQLFNKANFKTYWLSNQKPLGLNETLTTIISKNCDEQVFINTTDKSKDYNILKPLKRILKQTDNRKFIVIHLMGTHGDYSDRYPEEFNVFYSKPITKFKHKKAYETINAYDNAVLYNDHILSEIIKEIKTENSKSYVLYFSDHGEDVYENLNVACHTENKGTKPMYDIPFILWRSKKFKEDKNEFVFDVSRKYSSENLLYTLSDLSSVNFKEFISEKSIFNKHYEPEDRIILNNKLYDDVFNFEEE